MTLLTGAIQEMLNLFTAIGETRVAGVILVLVAALALGAITYLLLPIVLMIAVFVFLWELLGELGV